MSPHKPDFLRAIAADPGSDLPRLAYADSLEEAGEPQRAEFIRVQCELARLDDFDPRRPALESRSRRLEGDPDNRWAEELPRPRRAYSTARGLRRGFDETLAVDLSRWPEFEPLVPALTEEYPATRLELTGDVESPGAAGFPASFGSPALARFRELRVYLHDRSGSGPPCRHPLGAAVADALFASPHLGRLEGLTLTGFVPGNGWAGRAGRSLRFPALRSLAVDAAGLNDDDFVALAAGEWPGMRRLRLRGNAAAGDRLDEWLDSDLFARLDALDLSGNQLGIGLEGRPVATRPTRVRALDLRDCGLEAEGLRKLLLQGAFPDLKRLSLSDNPIDDAAARVVLVSPDLARVAELSIELDNVRPATVAALRQRFGPALNPWEEAGR